MTIEEKFDSVFPPDSGVRDMLGEKLNKLTAYAIFQIGVEHAVQERKREALAYVRQAKPKRVKTNG